MARPQKATVDYFPLDCTFGDSMCAIENLYGNNGYVVWVKLLQKLGRTANHYIDVRTNMNWKLFYSIFRLDENEIINILNSLAELDCIDKTLWEHKIIYSRNFVNRVSDAYKKRKIELLSYTDILALVGISGGRNPQASVVSSAGNFVSVVGNPQNKLKETKENKSKENNLSQIEDEISFEEREILTKYIKKECKADNIEAYLLTMIKNGSYKRVLEDYRNKSDSTISKEQQMQEHLKKVNNLYKACAFVGIYGDYTDKKHPQVVQDVMKKYGIESYSHGVELQRKCEAM